MSLIRRSLESNPRAVSRLSCANNVLTAVGYIAYPSLLVFLLLFHPDSLERSIEVPAIGFVFVSVFRRAYNAPRPYEVTGKPPLIPKSSKGRSFPSRHAFCIFMIAFTWMRTFWPAGALLAVLGCVLASVRVMLGVHFVKDVVAGALIAAAFAVVGYAIIP